jgi:protein gp37
VSEGCRNCYAERTAARFAGSSGHALERFDAFHGFAQMTPSGPRWTGKVELVEKHLEDPLHWRTPKRVFVNSMSDLWHEKLRSDDPAEIYAVMSAAFWHDYQVLTKRPQVRLDGFRDIAFSREVEQRRRRHFVNGDAPRFEWPLPNVWEGVSVENQATADERIPLLLQTPAAVRFVSYEPALGPVDFHSFIGPDVTYHVPSLDWVIVGGESGPGARPFDIAWARNIIAQCRAAGVACFVKQLGAKPYQFGDRPFELPRDRKGGDWDEWPEDLRVREFPAVPILDSEFSNSPAVSP